MHRYELHHFCYQIAPKSLEAALELFELLGFSLAYREGKARWALVSQAGKNVSIQLVETKKKPLSLDARISTHIALLSKSPVSDIEAVEKWAKDKGLKFVTGGWNDRERWFDLPEIFLDFVIEVMDVKRSK